ncbi:MAG: NAD+ synthase [Rickettsiales bacterium]|nr:NAD+ synthase [Rickettsiales bacterium]
MSKLKIQLSQINSTAGDLEGNCQKILQQFKQASEANCDLVIFPEMTICGYPCQDLWQKKYFIDAVKEKVLEILKITQDSKCAILLGAPISVINRSNQEVIFNSALLIENGEIKKIINKKTLANRGVFDEVRYFKADNAISLIEFRGQTLAILICEDLWDSKNLFLLREQIFDNLIVINASPYSRSKYQQRHKICQNFCQTLTKSLLYINQVGGQDSLVFDGSSLVMNSEGITVLQMAEFAEDSAIIELSKTGKVSLTKTKNYQLSNQTSRDYQAIILGLRDYVKKNGFEKVVIGMSGGIDSALTATIAVDAFSYENVMLYALPSRFNPQSSMIDAKECAENLGINLQTISIEMAFSSMLISLGNISALAKENLQARIRGNILMAISNDSGALLLTTGNKSELACGYSTLYGDMCGAFNPIKDLYKSEIYQLANWRNQNVPQISLYQNKNLIPQNIITKAPSAELREDQKDSDSLPEYEILDKILFALIEEQKSISEIIASGFAKDLVKKVAKLFYGSEYKRQQSCLGPKISDLAFDKDRRYPITNKFII